MPRPPFFNVWSGVYGFVAFMVFDGALLLGQCEEEEEVQPPDSELKDQFGYNSVKGDLAAIGAQEADSFGLTDSGRAYVYRRGIGGWQLEAELTPHDPVAGNIFGSWQAVGDGIVVVAARHDNHAGYLSGSAYVFRYVAGNWVEEKKLTASDAAAGDEFGIGLAVSGDWIVIGSHFHENCAGYRSGTAYVFHYEGGDWVEKQKLCASDAAQTDSFGISVAIDGGRIAVGAYQKDSEAGAAYLFELQGDGSWSQVCKLIPSDPEPGALFGSSVSLSGDWILVGAQRKSASTGAAYVFRRNGGGCDQEAKLVASDGGPGDNFGLYLSIDEDLAIISAPFADAGGVFSGAAYLFLFEGGSWNQVKKIVPSAAAAGAVFGITVSLSGGTALIGAPGNSVHGAAYFYEDPTISFFGFLSPLGGADETGGSFADPLRAFKLGSTVPVKFAASQCSGPLLTGIHTLQAIKYSNAVDSDPAIDATPTDVATTGNQFRLTDGQWHFNLSTKTGFSTGTWKLIATLSDGSTHYAWITLKN